MTLPLKEINICFLGFFLLKNSFNFWGYCTEFNEAGKVIQNHYAALCEDVSPKCDVFYRSSDAYKCMFIQIIE